MVELSAFSGVRTSAGTTHAVGVIYAAAAISNVCLALFACTGMDISAGYTGWVLPMPLLLLCCALKSQLS